VAWNYVSIVAVVVVVVFVVVVVDVKVDVEPGKWEEEKTRERKWEEAETRMVFSGVKDVRSAFVRTANARVWVWGGAEGA